MVRPPAHCGALVSIQLANEQNTLPQVQATGVVYYPDEGADVVEKQMGQRLQRPTKSNAVMQKIIGIAQEFTAPELVRTSEFNMYQNERWDEVSQKSIPEGFTLRHVFEATRT